MKDVPQDQNSPSLHLVIYYIVVGYIILVMKDDDFQPCLALDILYMTGQMVQLVE